MGRRHHKARKRSWALRANYGESAGGWGGGVLAKGNQPGKSEPNQRPFLQ